MLTDVSPPISTQNFLGIGFADLSFEKAINHLKFRAQQDRFSFVVTANVDHVNRISNERDQDSAKALQAAYQKAGVRLCDSKILAALARICGVSLHVVAGSDLTAAFFKARFFGAKKIAIVGGDEQIGVDLQRLFPGPNYVIHVPPMGIMQKPDAIDVVIDFVAASQADYTLFAIGCPQSEIIATRCLERADARGVGLCIGASIDFLRGKQVRAPIWMRKVGLEWAHRLFQEPKRMWRRYLLEGPRIFMTTLRWQLKRVGKGNERQP
jgi:N-acetylglucosaminyldiphosphoundecaprenol N-acetyl-beta-D-mannosaminyltransferase